MAEPTVFIVDDHAGVRDSIAELVDSVGLAHASFASARQYLDAFDPAAPGCLVLDVRMAHMSGPALQERLNGMGARIPIVFISAHADIDVAVRTVRAGAVNFVTKPYRDQQLLDSINEALARDAAVRAIPGAGDVFAAKLAILSARERQVTDLVVAGQSSKAIARTLGISPRTVELHRGHVFDKLGVKSVAELVRLVVEHRTPRA
jgi:FixJ family two-component response regulator